MANCNFETTDGKCKLANELCCGNACIFMQILPKVIEIDKQLRANIKKALSHGKNPRKQPDGSAWKKQTCNCDCGCKSPVNTFNTQCAICAEEHR